MGFGQGVEGYFVEVYICKKCKYDLFFYCYFVVCFNLRLVIFFNIFLDGQEFVS